MIIDKQLINKTLNLNPQERFYHIALLVRSLHIPDSEIVEIWVKQTEPRLKSHREDKTKGMPTIEVGRNVS